MENIDEIKLKISRNYFNNYTLQITELNLILKRIYTVGFALLGLAITIYNGISLLPYVFSLFSHIYLTYFCSFILFLLEV